MMRKILLFGTCAALLAFAIYKTYNLWVDMRIRELVSDLRALPKDAHPDQIEALRKFGPRAVPCLVEALESYHEGPSGNDRGYDEVVDLLEEITGRNLGGESPRLWREWMESEEGRAFLRRAWP